jgi:3-methyladenine DNA glycosylase AlkD
MSSQTDQIIARLHELGDPGIAAHSQGFFKTGPGEYGEGDIFLGFRVPAIRKCVKEYRDLTLGMTLDLLKSRFHEARLLALLIMVAKYTAARSCDEQESIYDSYLAHTAHINNWDLVDCSAEHIVGAHLLDRERGPIYRLARSKNLWERRIAIIATLHFIRRNDFKDTLAVAGILLHDREGLIHKATGWMLREVGKRDIDAEKDFLERHSREMPRTMLRYAIERFPEEERLTYLKGGFN